MRVDWAQWDELLGEFERVFNQPTLVRDRLLLETAQTQPIRHTARARWEDTGKVWLFHLELPGVHRGNIKVERYKDILSVDYSFEGQETKYKERLPKGLSDKASAVYMNGLLTITFVKEQPDPPTEIPII